MKTSRALHPLLVVSLIAASALGLAACGSGDSASTSTSTRGATSGTTCPEQKSVVRYITFTNDLRTNVVLDVPRASWSCDGFSGTSTPGGIDGRTIGSTSGVIRLEMLPLSHKSASKAAFGVRLRAGNAVLANLSLKPFKNGSGWSRLGIVMDGSVWCDKPLEVRDASGNPVWVQAICGTGSERDDPWKIQITGTKPS